MAKPKRSYPTEEAAYGYLGRGWSVIPAHMMNGRWCTCQTDCASPGKHPRLKSWLQYQRQRATHKEVETWWTRWNSNVAVVTGEVSGIIVLDVDERHDGMRSLATLGALPATLTAKTGGGGLHLYFKHPGGKVPNGAGLLPGIDLRGDGGYVIAPPSNHQSGGMYTWEDEAAPVAPLSETVRKLISTYKGKQTTIGIPDRFDLDALMAFGTVPNGTRNNTMTRIAGHYAAQGLSLDEVMAHVNGANRLLCDPVLATSEIKTIVESILGRETAKRASQRNAEALLEGKGDLGDTVATDPEGVRAYFWGKAGVTAVVDWAMVRGSDRGEYVLTTPAEEVRLGSDLLDYRRVRQALFNDAGIVLTPMKEVDWFRMAKHLKDCVREEQVEPIRAGERVQEWAAAYLDIAGRGGMNGDGEWDPEERKSMLSQGPIVVEGRVHLRLPRFQRFVEDEFGDHVGTADLRRLLKRAGYEPFTLSSPPTTVRTWREKAA